MRGGKIGKEETIGEKIMKRETGEGRNGSRQEKREKEEERGRIHDRRKDGKRRR